MTVRLFSIVASVLALGVAAFAAEPENILMIEVDGQANGIIEIELLPEIAPLHVERIKTLARDGAYNDVAFHRVYQGFMAQTGDVKHGKRDVYLQRYAGQGGSNYPDLVAEFSDEPFSRGTVGMARTTEPNTANSQFFIVYQETPHLVGAYTVVGRVIDGMDVVDQIKLGSKAANGSVADPDFMKRVVVKSDEQ